MRQLNLCHTVRSFSLLINLCQMFGRGLRADQVSVTVDPGRKAYGKVFLLRDLNAADLLGDIGTQQVPELVVA